MWLVISSLSSLTHPILIMTLQKNSELVEDDTNGEVEIGCDSFKFLEQPSSKFNWIQKILSSARVGGISDPLVRVSYHQNVELIDIVLILMVCFCSMPPLFAQLIQSSILFDNFGTSSNKGGVVDDGAERSLKLASASKSRIVIVRDGNGVLIQTTVNEEELAYSKPEVSKDVSNLSLKLKAGDDGQEYNIVDVSTLVYCPHRYFRILFLTPSLLD